MPYISGMWLLLDMVLPGVIVTEEPLKVTMLPHCQCMQYLHLRFENDMGQHSVQNS